jgi:hypothetical protein
MSRGGKMPGMIIRGLDKTTYDKFDANSLAGGKSAIFVVATNIDVSQFTYMAVALRVHNFTGANGATVVLQAYPSAPTSDDPATVFRGASAITTTSIAWASPQVNLAVNGSTIGTVCSGTVDLVLTITQPATAVSLNITVSADVILRS